MTVIDDPKFTLRTPGQLDLYDTGSFPLPVVSGMSRNLIRAFLDGDVTSDDLPEPRWGPIGREVYERTYSRDIQDSAGEVVGKETWADTVKRVVLGNLGYVDARTHLAGEAEALFDMLYNFYAVPAGRHLWVTGTAVQFSRNCWTSGWSSRTSDHFKFLASRLFEGGGVGANYSSDLIASTQSIVGTVGIGFACDPAHPDFDQVSERAGDQLVEPDDDTFVVDDSREGWVAAWIALIDLACTPGEHRLIFDVSNVREYGAVLRTFGGRASGPAPLVSSLAAIGRIVNGAGAQTRRLSGLEAMSIDHEIASAVVAGGNRRSARMSMMNWSDPEVFEFLNCKVDQMSHWSTNISVEIDEEFHEAFRNGDPHAVSVFAKACEGMATNGEPGLIDTALSAIGESVRPRATNPCGEVALTFDRNDAAGEACNLGSVNLDAFGTDVDSTLIAFKLMTRFLVRATENPYPDESAARIEARNRRIGTGLMGFQGWAAAWGTRMSEVSSDPTLVGLLNEFRNVCRTSANDLADQLAIPHPIKVTAIAPTGSISQMSGCTPGVSPVFARYFIRRVRYANSDPKLAEMRSAGYRIVDDIYAENTSVVEIPVRDQIVDKHNEALVEQSDEINVSDYLALIACVQSSFCASGDGNAISYTAQVPQGMDPAELGAQIAPHLGTIKGVTVFPQTSRELSPMEAVSKETFEALRDDLIDRSLAEAAGDSGSGECAGGACPVR